ncbi:unnamed protein product [Acanthosepion pharaonis]|uniref:Uncharacterized protein n=1 Tax=Acanthosepion pharaonis TaxID=158019 RepID=A0A812D4F1_ACAPH|nr:unnamed protein product [Sepia pharaonis]
MERDILPGNFSTSSYGYMDKRDFSLYKSIVQFSFLLFILSLFFLLFFILSYVHIFLLFIFFSFCLIFCLFLSFQLFYNHYLFLFFFSFFSYCLFLFLSTNFSSFRYSSCNIISSFLFYLPSATFTFFCCFSFFYFFISFSVCLLTSQIFSTPPTEAHSFLPSLSLSASRNAA